MPEKLALPGVPPIEHLPFAKELLAAIVAGQPVDAKSREHYIARSAECRRLAATAADMSIELIHLDMANRYDLLARQAEQETPHLRSVK